MFTENEEKNNPGKMIKINQQLRSCWKVCLEWALFLGITGATIITCFALFIGKSVISELINGFVYFSIPYLTDPVVMGCCLSMVVLLIANIYQIRFSIKLKSALKTNNQVLFERAWSNFRNYAMLFAVFIFICTVVLVYNTLDFFIDY